MSVVVSSSAPEAAEVRGAMKHTWDGYRLPGSKAPHIDDSHVPFFVGCQPSVPERFAGQKVGDMMKCNQALAEPRLFGIDLYSKCLT